MRFDYRSDAKVSSVTRSLMKRRIGATLKEMGKHGKALIAAAGRQSCAVNGPEWAESDETCECRSQIIWSLVRK